MASWVSLKGKAAFARGDIDWENDTIEIIPVSAEPNRATAEFVDDPIYYPDSSCIADLYPQWVLPGS